MSYSLEPVTHDQAIRSMAAAMQKSKWALFVTYLTGIAAAVAFGFVADDPSAPAAWLFFLVFTAACVVFSRISKSVQAGVRYRIAVPNAPFLLIGALVVGAAVWALVAWLLISIGGSALGPLNKILLFAMLATVVGTYATLSNRFTGNAHQLIFRKTRVPWNAVGHIVVTRNGAPGTVGIGVHPRGQVTAPMPVRPEEVLADLPWRVFVRAQDFDFDRLVWVVNQSGRTDVAIVDRGPVGEQLIRYSNART